MREGVGTFVVPQPSVVSEVWLQCLLSGGECCFLIFTCSYLEQSWCRVAAVVSASGAWVQLCPAAFDGDSIAWVLLRRLCLALPGVVTTLRMCLPRAPALRQVLEALLAEGALESPSILVLAFHSSLSLVEGSPDGLAASVRFLSPGQLSHSLRSC